MTHVREMTRDQLVSELRDMVIFGITCPHEIGDPTILPAPELRRLLVLARVRALSGARCHDERHGSSSDAP
ncbi:MAG: hypothetical protein AB7L91_12950 [Dehalococcoidia bacterium]